MKVPSNNVVVGIGASSEFSHCVVIGPNARSTADYQIVIGNERISASRALTEKEFNLIYETLLTIARAP